LAGCQKELYSGLSERDANQMVAVLGDAGISASKDNDARDTSDRNAWLVSVADGDMQAALTVLQANGLPKPSYASLGELSLHALLQNPSVVPALVAAGALLGITYTGLVQGSAFAHLSIERRSRVVRGIDLMSDLASIAGGAIAPFVGPHPA
ncbi:hypothetical protein M3583_24695, partial [Bacillus subtilis]|nr:hypothetical protein [Bacillus subtilis]